MKESTVELRDILSANIMNNDEYANDNEFEQYNVNSNNFNFFIDKAENIAKIVFDVKINGVSGGNIADSFVLILVSGNRNFTGIEKIEVIGKQIIISDTTVIEFSIPTGNFVFSPHSNLYSESMYALYAIIDKKTRSIANTSDSDDVIIGTNSIATLDSVEDSRLLISAGKILMTDIVKDMEEGNILW
jgi:hypothetical protein